MSFGFINTLVVLVLMVPFHKPILEFKKKTRENAKMFKKKFMRDERMWSERIIYREIFPFLAPCVSSFTKHSLIKFVPSF